MPPSPASRRNWPTTATSRPGPGEWSRPWRWRSKARCSCATPTRPWPTPSAPPASTATRAGPSARCRRASRAVASSTAPGGRTHGSTRNEEAPVAQTLKDLMTPNPLTVKAGTTIFEAAQQMRDQGIGDVIVTDGGKVCGIVTDRDIVVRAIADGREPTTTKVGDICSRDLVTLAPTADVTEAVTLMRERALRRLPVVENGKPVGIVSIGHLAIERDEDSALADIGAAPPNT